MDKNTIMPDGRPLFAWENEITMLRQREPLVDQRIKEGAELFRLLRIARITRQENPDTMEINIRISFVATMQRDYQYNPEKYWKITTKKREGE